MSTDYSTVALDRQVLDKLEITEVTAEFGLRIDTHEWDRLKELLAANVVIDYTSLHGKEPVRTDPNGVVALWGPVLSNLTSTQHVITGQVITVDGGTASCLANLIAQHYLPNESGSPTWLLGGRYEFGLERVGGAWRINRIVLISTWTTGNRSIMQLAGSRNSTK